MEYDLLYKQHITKDGEEKLSKPAPEMEIKNELNGALLVLLQERDPL